MDINLPRPQTRNDKSIRTSSSPATAHTRLAYSTPKVSIMNRYLEHPNFSIDNVTIPAGPLNPQQPMWPDDSRSNDSGLEDPSVCM